MRVIRDNDQSKEEAPRGKFIFSGNRLDFEKLNTRIQIEITQSKNAALLKEFMVDNFNDPLPEKIHRTSNS